MDNGTEPRATPAADRASNDNGTVGAGNGAATVALSVGQDLSGNVITATPTGGATFTVDNTGWTGSILTLPIINVPEVAIITMEKIVKRPVVLEDHGDAIAVRSMMNMCIAIDHRATDGAQAGAFLQDVAAWLGAVDADTPIW